MKKHLTGPGITGPLCGRQLARPGPGQQVASGNLVVMWVEVDCSWCLAEMAKRGMSLTADQWAHVARPSTGTGFGREEDYEEEEEEEAEFDDSKFP